MNGIDYTLEKPKESPLKPTLRVHESVKFFPKKIADGDFVIFLQQSVRIQPEGFGVLFTGSDLIFPSDKKFTTYISSFPPKSHPNADWLRGNSWFSHPNVDMCFSRIKNISDEVIEYEAGQPFIRAIYSDTVPIEEVLLGNNLKDYAKVAGQEIDERGEAFLKELEMAEVVICKLDKKHRVNLPNLLAYVNS